MSKNLNIFIFFLALLSIFLVCEVGWLLTKERDITLKKEFVKVVGLPDLSVSTEAKYVRHRSLSDIFSIFNENPISISYFVTTFVYAPSKIVDNTPNQIKAAK